MIGRSVRVVGIDLGSHLVKVSVLSGRNGPSATGMFPLEVSPVGGNRAWVDAAEGAVRMALETCGYPTAGATAVLVVPADWVELRWIEDPGEGGVRDSTDDLSEVVRQHLAADLQDAVFDFWKPGVERERLGVAFLVRSRAALLGELARRLRLADVVADAPVWCHARIAEMIEPGNLSPVGILDWGAKTIWFTSAVHGMPAFARRLPRLGLEDVLTTVARSLNVGLLDLRRFLWSCAGTRGSEASEALSEMVRDYGSPHAAQVAGEIERTLRYLETKHPEIVPERILVVGGGAMFPPLVDELGERLAPRAVVSLSRALKTATVNELTANALAACYARSDAHATAL